MAKRGRGKTMRDKKVPNTYTISVSDVIIRVGDYVLIRPKEKNKPLHVAQVEMIKQRGRKEVMISVRWFYRPEETNVGRLKFHGAKEVFYSDQCDEVSADTIEGTCSIHSFKNYTKLQPVEEEDYYCRFKYDVSTGFFASDNVTVYCKC